MRRCVYHELILTSREYMREVTAIEPGWLVEGTLLSPRLSYTILTIFSVVAPAFFKVADANKISKRKKQEKIEPLFDRFALTQVSTFSFSSCRRVADVLVVGRLETVETQTSIEVVANFLILFFWLYSAVLYRSFYQSLLLVDVMRERERNPREHNSKLHGSLHDTLRPLQIQLYSPSRTRGLPMINRNERSCPPVEICRASRVDEDHEPAILLRDEACRDRAVN